MYHLLEVIILVSFFHSIFSSLSWSNMQWGRQVCCRIIIIIIINECLLRVNKNKGSITKKSDRCLICFVNATTEYCRVSKSRNWFYLAEPRWEPVMRSYPNLLAHAANAQYRWAADPVYFSSHARVGESYWVTYVFLKLTYRSDQTFDSATVQ